MLTKLSDIFRLFNKNFIFLDNVIGSPGSIKNPLMPSVISSGIPPTFVVTIGKSTLYGGATGLLLGLALALVVDESTGDIMRWSFVTGTFGGFLIGVYHVANRPQPSSAMLQFNASGLVKVALPKPELRLGSNRSLGLRLNLVSLSF